MIRSWLKPLGRRALRALPERWQHLRWQLVSGEPHEVDIQLFGHLRDMEGLVLDIGANHGQFALSLFAVNSRLRVESWEPNRELADTLLFIKCLHPLRFRYRIQGAGEREDAATLYVPTSDRCDLSANASLSWKELDKSYVRDRLRTLAQGAEYRTPGRQVHLRSVDSASLRPLAVKIDVEGWEAAVLCGMAATLRAAYPLLMIELNNREQWMDWLQGLGYRMFIYHHNAAALVPARRHARALNSFWLHPRSPRPLLDALRPLLPGHAVCQCEAD